MAPQVTTNIEPLTFEGISGTIPAYLFSQEQSGPRLAVVLPGAGYSYREPLLRFAIQILLKNHYRVIALDKIYGEDPRWKNLTSEQEARGIVEEDTVKVFQQIEKQFSNSVGLLLGRSLGTYAIACLLDRDLVQPHKIVWQTPALGTQWTTMRDCKIPGFGILGTADHYYETAMSHLPQSRLVVEDADHGMEIPGDPVRTIEILKQVTVATDEWIARG